MNTMSVVQACNQTAALLQQGRYMESIGHAKNAIAKLKETNLSHSQTFSSGNPKPQILLAEMDHVPTTKVDEEADNVSSLFARAFFFQSENFCIVQYQKEVAAVLLFNLSIAKHLHALSSEGAATKSKQLEAALHVYKLALAALQSCCSVDNDAALTLLAMGTFANMAHIHHHFLREPQAQECVQHIRMFLPRIDSFECCNKEQEFFYMTLIVGCFRTAAIAPAA